MTVATFFGGRIFGLRSWDPYPVSWDLLFAWFYAKLLQPKEIHYDGAWWKGGIPEARELAAGGTGLSSARPFANQGKLQLEAVPFHWLAIRWTMKHHQAAISVAIPLDLSHDMVSEHSGVLDLPSNPPKSPENDAYWLEDVLWNASNEICVFIVTSPINSMLADRVVAEIKRNCHRNGSLAVLWRDVQKSGASPVTVKDFC
ncbi:hypothetical protein FIBSPDRAFT_883160 [Athelia psychrophila]|uniref:Uncharacterized protein n=1 Tax=Athelia psychrophila TaxID=1759441 RepID=A0A166UMB0_9AGAM|nr:hypothetical protein FIBSPDRAFT_883160 [Fibularhizoctonia sp. CBS 109695]